MTHNELTNYFYTMIETGKISHAILVDGVTCEEDKKPVKSFVKKIIGSLDSNDIVVLQRDLKKKSISVDEVEEQITSVVPIKPYANERRVFIIPEAERMGPQAQNKLLKTLEEPPSYAIIILLANNANSLIETIRSRCQILSLTTEDGEIFEGEIEETYLKYAASFPNLSDIEALKISNEIVNDIKKGSDRKSNRITYEMFFTFVRNIYRDAFAINQGYEKLLMPRHSAISRKLSEAPEKSLIRRLEAIDKAEYNIKREVNKELTIRTMILEMK